ncbi:MAG: hypothetical protein ACYC09_03285 [Bacteroidota bacterium]
MEKTKIVIMADFGGCPYAWVESECVGDGNGFEPEYNVSPKLQHEFSEWIIKFDDCFRAKDFDWTSFHTHGLMLTKKLMEEVGDQFAIEYHYPVEDLNYQQDYENETGKYIVKMN